MQFLAETGLPAGFCPGADDVLADAVEGGVLRDEGEDPVREEVDVRVAVGGENSDFRVFAEEAVPDGEGFFVVADVF